MQKTSKVVVRWVRGVVKSGEIRMPGWRMELAAGDELHVMPKTEVPRPHQADEGCWCHPKAEYREHDGAIFVHGPGNRASTRGAARR